MPVSPPLHRPHFARAPSSAPQHDLARPDLPANPYDAAWRRLRDAFIAQHPLCLFCEREGRVTATQEVDHIIDIFDRPDLRLAWGNLRALCKPHHSRRTGRDVAARAAQRGA